MRYTLAVGLLVSAALLLISGMLMFWVPFIMLMIAWAREIRIEKKKEEKAFFDAWDSAVQQFNQSLISLNTAMSLTGKEFNGVYVESKNDPNDPKYDTIRADLAALISSRPDYFERVSINDTDFSKFLTEAKVQFSPTYLTSGSFSTIGTCLCPLCQKDQPNETFGGHAYWINDY